MPVRQPTPKEEHVEEHEPPTRYDLGAAIGKGLGYLALVGLVTLGALALAAVAGILRAVFVAAYAWGLTIL